jgi:hypothetical protein
MHHSTKSLLTALRSAAEDCIFVPNDCEHPDDVAQFGPSRTLEILPGELRNESAGGRTLADLTTALDRRDEKARPSAHALEKAAKAKAVESYAAEWAANGENGQFDYESHADEARLARNEQTFVALMVEAGMIDDDE